MRKILFLNIMLVGIVGALLAGASTLAYFSDDASDTGASFRAGTLAVELSNNGGATWAADIPANWVTPANWAPGNTADLTLFYKNTGTVSAHSAIIDYQYVAGSCTGPNLLDKIQVMSWQESFDGGGTWPIDNIPGIVSAFDANADGKLSLWELINGDTMTPGGQSPSPYDVAWYTPNPTQGDQGAWGNPGGPSADVLPFGNPDLLPAGGPSAGMKLTLKFMEDAGNAYQNASCAMNIVAKFVQVPGARPWNSLAGY